MQILKKSTVYWIFSTIAWLALQLIVFVFRDRFHHWVVISCLLLTPLVIAGLYGCIHAWFGDQ